MGWLQDIASTLSPASRCMCFCIAAIVFFCFFYTALVFNAGNGGQPEKVGAFIPGIRPGEQTANYIDSVLTR